MKVLVIGSGGREHTIVWKLAKSDKVKKIYCAPGNAGTALHGENINIDATDIGSLCEFAKKSQIDLTVVGPEIPLMEGIVDQFQKEGLLIFGPTKQAAMLEGSKVFAKKIMTKYNVPTADYVICGSKQATLEATAGKEFPYLIKVDGLAAGKGALIINNENDRLSAIATIWEDKKFGAAADQVLIEDFLKGEEVSVFAITDGKDYVLLHPAQDHKRVFDDDKGLNTGGMGAYAPAPLGSSEVLKKSAEKVIDPIIQGMRNDGHPFAGVLYCGLMIYQGEPSVVEFNVRFGDPEAQVIIPLIESDLVDLLYSIASGKIEKESFKLAEKYATCVVMASGGYPGSYEKSKKIFGIDENQESENSLIFLAGTSHNGSDYITSGGRVLGITAISEDLKSSIERAYTKLDKVHFEKAHYRTDIGKKGLKNY